MNKEFELFKKEFKKWQREFGLMGYQVRFKYEPLDGAYAKIDFQQEDMAATVTLDSETTTEERGQRSVAISAKHEAIHLLLAKLEHRAMFRFGYEGSIYETVEELAYKLEELIK